MNERHTQALELALQWIDENFQAIGIIASGSIIRGNADENSDFDIYVIQEEKFKQRIQKKFNGLIAVLFDGYNSCVMK